MNRNKTCWELFITLFCTTTSLFHVFIQNVYLILIENYAKCNKIHLFIFLRHTYNKNI